jgi:hypothetical protein
MVRASLSTPWKRELAHSRFHEALAGRSALSFSY